MSEKTIDPEHAADLYELFDDHDVITRDVQDDTNTMHEWIVLGSAPSRTSRWHERYWMVLENAEGETWGVEYGIGLTENQEDLLPWEDRLGPLPMTRLYPHEVTTVEYRTKPPGEQDGT